MWSNFQTLSSQVDGEATITAALYQDMATYPAANRRAWQQELNTAQELTVRSAMLGQLETEIRLMNNDLTSLLTEIVRPIAKR